MIHCSSHCEPLDLACHGHNDFGRNDFGGDASPLSDSINAVTDALVLSRSREGSSSAELPVSRLGSLGQIMTVFSSGSTST